MQFQVGAATDIGRRRAKNQDSFASAPELGLFIVSDGMGGHQGGEIASSTAVEVISSFVRTTQAATPDWIPEKLIQDAISKANETIFEKAKLDASLEGMGTTTTALLFKDQTLWIGHVGDSRCYYIRPNSLWQATRDHSLVQEKLRAGLITRAQVKTDKMKNVITRSVGYEMKVEVETYQMKVNRGDCFLVCSDGLSGLLEDSELLELVETHAFEKGDFQLAVNLLIEKANAQGGDDNITSILVQVL